MTLRGPGPGQTVTTPIASPTAQVAASLAVRKWFTTLRLVRTLYIGSSGSTDVQNEELLLVNNNRLALKNGHIVVDSERIKQRVSVVGPDSVTFTCANAWVSLAYDDVVRGSVQVFDSAESTVKLQEGADYEIDYKGGRIKRVQAAGSAGNATGVSVGTGSGLAQTAAQVTVQQSVKVHYDYFANYVKDQDYQIQYEEGFVTRLSGGAIANGARVYVDYCIDTNIAESIITSMIDQAHIMIMS
jgi:hypothetical protein